MNRKCERCEKQNMSLEYDCVLDLEEIIDIRGKQYERVKNQYDLNAYFCFNRASKTIEEIET